LLLDFHRLEDSRHPNKLVYPNKPAFSRLFTLTGPIANTQPSRLMLVAKVTLNVSSKTCVPQSLHDCWTSAPLLKIVDFIITGLDNARPSSLKLDWISEQINRRKKSYAIP
jgi:hypothetical protein